MTEAQQQSLLNVQSNLSSVSKNIESNMLNKIEKFEESIKEKIFISKERKDEIGRSRSYKFNILFEITKAGINFWKNVNKESYEKAGSPKEGYITNLYNIKEGPFEYPFSLIKLEISGFLLEPSLKLIGLKKEESEKYALQIYINAKNEQILSEPVLVLEEKILYAKDFVYNSINEYQGDDPFRLLKELPNKKSGFICDMSEFNDGGGDSFSGIISKESYKNYEVSFDIKFTQIAKYRNLFRNSVGGFFFGYTYKTTNNKIKGFAGNGCYQLELGYQFKDNFLNELGTIYGPGGFLNNNVLELKPENVSDIYQEIFDNMKNDNQPIINYRIIHYENLVKIFMNNRQMKYILTEGNEKKIIDIIDVGVNYGSFGFQVQATGYEITNLKIKPGII